MPSKSKRESLPFEPQSNKSSKGSSPASSGSDSKQAVKAQKKRKDAVDSDTTAGIPEVVSRRMIRRMAVFAGIPTFLGMASFVVSYFLLTHHIVEFPNVVVLLVSLGFFGLGTVGLSYGVLSASWQEEDEGSLLGTAEFAVNFRRLVQGLRKPKESSASD